LIELACRNEKAQVLLCEQFSFSPVKGQVALNPIPQFLQLQLAADPSLLNMIKNQFANVSYQD
jgi:hypothetical protein